MSTGQAPSGGRESGTGVEVITKGFRLLDLSRAAASPLRLLIYHPRCDEYASVLSGQVPLEDVTPSALHRDSLETVDVLLAWKCPAPLLSSLTRLRWVQTTSTGIDQILDYYRHHPDLIVTTTKGFPVESVASLALLMMLALHWQLPVLLEHQSQHSWYALPMREVPSKATCAVVGLGRIGQRVATYARHLGMTVVGMKRHMEPVPGVDRLYGEDRLHEMLGVADFVVLTLPLTDRTRRMFGEAELRAMKRSAYLINVARGGVVDEAALLAALESSTIAGAAMDVFEEEPLPQEHPLWRAPNMIITPHVGGDRKDYVEGVAAVFVQNLKAFPDSGRMLGVASAREGY